MEHPFRIEFASWGEAVVHLRSHLLRDGAPMSPDDMGELLLRRVGRGSARRWTGWLRGGRTFHEQLEDSHRAEGLATLARLFLEHWPEVIVPSRAGAVEADQVPRLAAALAALPVHAPDRAPEPISGASLQSLVRAYLDDHGLRHADLAERLSAKLRADPLHALLAGDADAPIRQWHVQRIASGKGLDADSPPYYQLVRAFAALRDDEPGPYFQLPFRSAVSQLGVFLRAHLSAPGGDDARVEAAACEAFERLSADVLARTVHARMDAYPARYAAFEALERRTEKDGGFALSLRLKPTLGLPPSTTYAPALLLLAELARQLRLAWSAHELNVSRVRTGAPPVGAGFVLHAGVRPALDRIARAQLPPHGSRIGFTSDAYYHARAADLRISWVDGPASVPGSGPSAPGAGERLHVVQAFHSHIYYGEVESFRHAQPAGVGRGPTLRELARANPVDVFFGIELAVFLFQRGRFEEALQVARQTLAVDARHPTAWAVIALAYGNLARLHAAGAAAGPVADFDAVARYYHRGLSAARMAIDADRSQEDAHVMCGCLHLLRALDGLRWYDRALVASLRPSADAVRLVLAGSGFAWAADPGASDVAALLRRAALEDLVEARAEFDRGVEVSPTKSRSLFWRLLADAFLDLAARDVPGGPSGHISLAAALSEIGWMPAGAGEAATLELLQGKIEEYDCCLLLETYRPEVHLAYAVVYWDFFGQSDATRRRARAHLERALALACALAPAPGEAERSIMRCWGFLQPRATFEAHVGAALALLDRCEKTGTYAPLHPLYIGESISRAFPEFLASILPRMAQGAPAPAAPADPGAPERAAAAPVTAA